MLVAICAVASGCGLLHNRVMSAFKSPATLLLLHIAVLLVQPAHGEIVDRIVAVMDGGLSGESSTAGQIITWSAAYEEACYLALQSGAEPPHWPATQSAASDEIRGVVSRLIDQNLLLQALNRSPFAPSSETDVRSRTQGIAKRFPDPQSFRDALARYHLTEAALSRRLERESLIMAFVDSTLRPDVNISSDEIESYYQRTLVPELRLRGQAGEIPPVEEFRDRIQEILVQQEMDRRLEQWLGQLRRNARIELRLE